MTPLPEPPPSNPAVIYERELVPAMFRPWSEELLRRLLPRVGERALDVACGTGIIARQLAPIVGAAGRVVGLDVSAAMLAVARSLPAPDGAPVEWVEGRAEALPLADGALDLVLCQQGLQFVPDRAAAVAEMRRVLAPGGRVGVAVWRPAEEQPMHRALTEVIERLVDVDVFATGFSLGDDRELRALMEGAGLRGVAVEVVERLVHFPSADAFVRDVVLGAAASLPELQRMTAADRDAMVVGVRRDAGPILTQFAAGDGPAFPMRANVAVAAA